MPSVIFRTHGDTLPGVVIHARHALQRQPALAPGDTILLAQTLETLPRGERPIRYRMTFVRTYLDQNGETDRIWGRHWRYVIEGEALRALRRPFNIAELQVSAKNYGRGGPIVHVDPLDEEILRRDGYFDALRDG